MSTDKAPRSADSTWLGEFVPRSADQLPVRVPKPRKPSAKPR
ncbi:hypothetical protein OG203_39340 [Nocardia sp. NBC_01499]